MGLVSADVDLFEFERPLVSQGQLVVGIDEVGRGALAGPLTVGAVVITTLEPPPQGLNDSKLLSVGRRESLVAPIEEWSFDFALGWVNPNEIDQWGMSRSLSVAATRALDQLRCRPTHALIDGTVNVLKESTMGLWDDLESVSSTYGDVPVTLLIKGDRRSAVIAAASILAKVRRDAYMVEIDREWQQYGWSANKGYGASAHMDALRRFGPSPHHRTSWNLPPRELS